jgi:hypothetical protein
MIHVFPAQLINLDLNKKAHFSRKIYITRYVISKITRYIGGGIYT